MSRRLFLHVGPPKTGTTFLQRVMSAHRGLLRERGLLFPDPHADHYLAALDVRGEHWRAQDPRQAEGAWARLVRQVSAWSGDVLISHELFAPAARPQAGRALSSLEGTDVHVVVTARDWARQIPAAWQERVKHRATVTFPDFVASVQKRERGGRGFWFVHDFPEVLDRWGHELPRSNLHVVTVPPAGADPSELWDRFTRVLGIDGSGFDLTKGWANTSLRAEQATLLRMLNVELGDRLPRPGPYPAIVKSMLAHEVLAGRSGTPFGLNRPALDFAVQRGHQMVARLQEMGVDVVGDLEDLVPPDDAPAYDSTGFEVSTQAVLDEAVAALAAVLDRYSAERSSRRRLVARLDRSPRPVRRVLRALRDRGVVGTR